MDWLWVVVALWATLLGVSLGVALYQWGRRRGYEDGYDVGYGKSTQDLYEAGELPTKSLADFKRGTSSAGTWDGKARTAGVYTPPRRGGV